VSILDCDTVFLFIFVKKTNLLKLLFSFITAIAACATSFAQTAAPISDYFDKDWKTITDPSRAAYYRTIEQNDKGFVVRDYFISGKLVMMAECSKVSPKLVKEGKSMVYYENGNVKEEGTYHNNTVTGLRKTYFEDGKPKSETSGAGDDIRYLHYWNENGEDKLVDGEGVIVEPGIEGFDNHKIVKNFQIVDSYSINRNTRDTVYFVIEQQPEYPGGYGQMMLDIQKNMYYPKNARVNEISGTVFVTFIVNKDGSISDVALLRGIDPECDGVALNAVSKLGKWNPGMQKPADKPKAPAKPVAVRFNIPVKFTLN
jgi:TonB family protein